MPTVSLGDLAQSLMLRHRGTALKQAVSTLTQELSTGQVRDVATRLGGDFSHLADLDRSAARLEGFRVSAGEARLAADAAQASLGRLQDGTASLATDILSTVPTHVEALLDHVSDTARQTLGSVVSALNTSVAGQSLFGGTATDRAPLAPPGALLAALKSAVAGNGTAAGIRAAADAWFADPAGFAATIYSGSQQSRAPLQVGPDQQADLPLRADDPVFRAALRDVALVALAADPGLGLDQATRNALLREGAEALLAGQENLAGVRAGLGYAQSRIEEAVTRNEAETTAIELARGKLLEADAYETAVRLENAQFQLESLYALTVRNARLTLLNYM